MTLAVRVGKCTLLSLCRTAVLPVIRTARGALEDLQSPSGTSCAHLSSRLATACSLTVHTISGSLCTEPHCWPGREPSYTLAYGGLGVMQYQP